MNIIDMTHTFWREWVMNVILRSYSNPKLLEDLEVPLYWKKAKKIIVTGAGSSLKLIKEIWDEDTLVVGNQSSVGYLADNKIPVDIIIITDPQKIAAEKLSRSMQKLFNDSAEGQPFEPVVIAAYHVTHLLENILYSEDEKLHPLYYVPMYSQNAKAYNAVLAETTDPTKAYCYQVGNVVNASVFILNVLHNMLKIKKMPIVLCGLDLSFGKVGETPMDHIEEQAAELPAGGYLEKDGEIVDVKFVKYEEQLQIVKDASQLSLYIHNPGSRLCKIVPEWRI